MKNTIEQLKKQKNAVILAHYYAPDEAQEVADFVGDSFYLAKVAKESTAHIIVFCGVSFMGESAKILCPDKKVLMPDLAADCAMAHMVQEGKIEEMREKYDDLAVVCYINSTADLKCQTDVCVTSSNAVKIVKALPNQHVFFIPDHNLGKYVAQQVPEKHVILNDGCCPIHAKMSVESVLAEKAKHPTAKVLAHPECNHAVLEMADFIGSTAEIIAFANEDTAHAYIVCTEVGVKFRLREDNPQKQFYFPTPCPYCADMKSNTLQNILSVLQNEDREVHIDAAVREQALRPLLKMLELGK